MYSDFLYLFIRCIEQGAIRILVGYIHNPVKISYFFNITVDGYPMPPGIINVNIEAFIITFPIVKFSP